MDARDAHLSATAHLNDLQAGVEADSRAVESLTRGAVRLQRMLTTHNADHAAVIAALVGQMRELGGSVQQQLEILRELRRDVRLLRPQSRPGRAS